MNTEGRANMKWIESAKESNALQASYMPYYALNDHVHNFIFLREHMYLGCKLLHKVPALQTEQQKQETAWRKYSSQLSSEGIYYLLT